MHFILYTRLDSIISGYVNCHNRLIWNVENSSIFRVHPLHTWYLLFNKLYINVKNYHKLIKQMISVPKQQICAFNRMKQQLNSKQNNINKYCKNSSMGALFPKFLSLNVCYTYFYYRHTHMHSVSTGRS